MNTLKLRFISLALLVTFATAQHAYGAVEVIVFFAKWCAPCHREVPIIERLRGDFPSVNFRGVNVDQTQAEGQKFVESTGMSYPWVFDSGHQIAKRMGIADKGLPSIVVQKNGQTVKTINHSVSYEELKSILDQHAK